MKITFSFSVAIVGGGLAGCECALHLAEAGINVTVFEMKPEKFSEAHSNSDLAELVCSNSFRSDASSSAAWCLKEEMRLLGSSVLAVAEETRVPAGNALAVDRELFAKALTQRIEKHSRIRLVRKEITSLESEELAGFSAVVLATGPLTSAALAESLKEITGETELYFYDAIAPVVDGTSIATDIAFWGARYEPDDKDYLNCPMSREEYFAFRQALIDGQKVTVKNFEEEKHFEGCMPIEVLAERGEMTLAFGSLKPVGFIDPRTGERPFAVLQLRTENLNKTMFNLVGCQTKLMYSEQKKVFRMIPGLEQAEFVRFGSMHRNTYVNAPRVLDNDLSLKKAPHIHLAGQITGVEGYVESAACGLWLGYMLSAKLARKKLAVPPCDTALGALLNHLQTPVKNFQPSNVQFGLMPELGIKAKKAERKNLYAKRCSESFALWYESFQAE